METIAAQFSLDTLLGICVGIGLAASCGFRVFVPLLVISSFAKFGYLTLSESFQWIGTWPALFSFSVATALEIGGYYLPWIDNLLDSAGTPVSILAGTIATAACVVEVDPVLRWSVAVIAGGGAAGTVKFGTTALRAASTTTTAGLGNFLISTMELVLSIVVSLLAVVLPLFTVVAVLLAIGYLIHIISRRPTAGR